MKAMKTTKAVAFLLALAMAFLAPGCSSPTLAGKGEQVADYRWACPIRILWGSGDNMMPREAVEAYARRQGARLTVLEGGEHWFHTPEQLTALKKWEETEC